MPSPTPGIKPFARKISALAGYVDTALVEKMYFAMLRVILNELRDHDECYLPQFGNLETIIHKGNPNAPIYSGEIGVGAIVYGKRKPKRVIKFRPNSQLKYYIANKLKKGELEEKSP